MNLRKGIASMERKEQLKDWTKEMVLSALREKEITLRELAIQMGYAGSSFYGVFNRDSYQAYEQLIAEFLGYTVEDIWPVRVAARREKAERRARSLLEAKALAARQVA